MCKEYKAHQLIKIMFDLMSADEIKYMIYGGCQSGIWGQLALRYMPSLKVIGVEANPNVYLHYYSKLSKLFEKYIHAALLTNRGLAQLYILSQSKPASNFLEKIDKKFFWRYHRDMEYAREAWRTDASVFADMALVSGSQDQNKKQGGVEVTVASIVIEDLLPKNEKILIFLDIQGSDFDILNHIRYSLYENIRMIYVEFDRVFEHPNRHKSYENFIKRFELLGFIYFGNDKLEGDKSFNMLFIKQELNSLVDTLTLPENAFKFNLEGITEVSIISRLRQAKLPGYTLIGRLISIFRIDVHKEKS